MKRLCLLFALALLVYGSTSVWAQQGVKPKLTSITFLNGNNGAPIPCTSGGNVAVQLLFNKAMKNSIKPILKYGLKGGLYNLAVPSGGNWQDTTLFQVIFNINANVPAGPDGEYAFLIFGARDSLNNVAMDSTYSDSLNTSLAIYRNSSIVSEKDSIAFGVVKFGKSKLDSVYLTFAGCNNVTINSAAVLDTRHFALLNNLAGVLQSGDSLSARIRYQPASRQAHQTRLRVIYTVNANPDTVEVVLRGRAKGPRIVFAPTAINFGLVSVNNSSTRQVLVINSPAGESASSDTLRIERIASSWNSIFQVNPLDLPRVLAPADTDTVRVTFRPTEGIAYNANLIFTTNDSGPQAGDSIPLSGTGNVNQPPDSIRVLNINWAQYGGYPGYASGDFLYVCLPNRNANDVAFVRWKIITSNLAPQSASDTTGSAIPDTSGGTFCFRIPLRNIVATGRNYCWIWLDGTNGASGFSSAYYSPLYYYSGAPAFVNWNISNVYWPGGFPYFTNANLIPICWTVQDGRNIAEVRWKLVRGLNPPTSANDTTNGDRFRLGALDTTQTLSCANLRLNKLFQIQGYQGYWYAYFWVIDKAGISGHANAVAFRFKLDTTAPVAPGGPSARTIPVLTWFGANQNWGLTLALPNLSRDAARVRWKFNTLPTNTSTPDGEVLLTRSGDNASFNVLFNSSALCGDDTLYYWVADSSGNANPLSYSQTRYRFDMCPPTLTRARSLTNNIAPIGQAFTDRLLVQDAHSGVDTVWVNYRLGGASTEAPPLPALRVGTTDTFQFTIPMAGVTRRGIEFRATARDQVLPAYNGPNLTNGPTNGPSCYGSGGEFANAPDDDTYWYPIRTRTLGEGDYRIDANGNPVPLAAGDATNSYQLFSIPYNLADSSAINTLQDDLGAYDAKQWRLFDYDPRIVNNPLTPADERFLEGTKVRPFTPGRSFFIITRKPNIVLDSGLGTTRRTVCPDTLTVYEGWNLIATPFNFPVHKRSLRLVNANQDTVSLWSFENQWTFTDVMDAWRGYAVYVVRNPNTSPGTPIRLTVQPVAVPGRIGKASAEPFALQAQEWAVQIAAQANGAQDNFNWAGVRANAQVGFDGLELAEPPVIGGYVAVSFPRAEWEQPAERFATDFRPSSDEDQAWEFEVATNQTHANVRVSFNFLGEVPVSANVFVIDEALGIAQNLRTNTEYTFRTGGAPVQKKLKLVVGSEQFAAKQAGEIALVPAKFEILQNYPNPFNPETSIRYNLPEAASVSVVIYDQLGRRVRTLLDNALQQAGYQNVLWDGRDAASRPVATGIYLYKVTAGKQALVRKMVLAK